MAEPRPARRLGPTIRGILRSLHRDAGYLAVGLTFVYAASGIAVNHLKDWDPNFTHVAKVHQLKAPLPASDDAAAAAVLGALHIAERPRELYRSGDQELEILFDKRTLHANVQTGTVTDEADEPRFLLRAANWLHLNRGKKAWTLVADVYAAGLLFLAASGIFMIPGRKGIAGRGALMVGLGAAVPILYVVLSGGP
jgi:hypothetical protein